MRGPLHGEAYVCSACDDPLQHHERQTGNEFRKAKDLWDVTLQGNEAETPVAEISRHVVSGGLHAKPAKPGKRGESALTDPAAERVAAKSQESVIEAQFVGGRC